MFGIGSFMGKRNKETDFYDYRFILHKDFSDKFEWLTEALQTKNNIHTLCFMIDFMVRWVNLQIEASQKKAEEDKNVSS